MLIIYFVFIVKSMLGLKESLSPLQTSMKKQRIIAMAQMLRSNDNLGDALLVALGVFSTLLVFQFYPIYLSIIIAALCGAIAYRFPPGGTIAGMLFSLPAIAYQAPALAWVFTIALAITLFEAFTNWSIISFLQIVVFMPFFPEPFSLFSGFLMFFLGVAALRFGSRKSFILSTTSILLVLLLSTIWLFPTSSLITISSHYKALYGPPMEAIQINQKPPVGIEQIVAAGSAAIGSMFDFSSTITAVYPSIEKLLSNAAILFVQDFGLIQLSVWSAALYACAFLPAHISHKNRQTIAALSLFLIPLSNLLLAGAFKNPIHPEGFAYAALSVAAIWGAERFGISLSQEKIIEKRNKQKQFGKFGDADLQDVGLNKLDDIGGYEDVKAELRDAIITPIKRPEYALTYNIKPPKGILLFGPPGTGKTMIMRALANELDIGFRYVKCSDLLSEWYGESEKNLAELFAIARKNAPFLLFFDEIDSIGRKRDAYTSDDVAPRVMSVLLQELDGFSSNPKKPVIFVGATNIPDQLDSALMRPGRFDKIIYMPLPNKEARKAIFKVSLKGLPVAHDIDYDRLAAMTERYSGADIKNITVEASRLAAREAMGTDKVVSITMAHLTSMIKKIKPSVSLESLENYENFRMDFERRSDAEEKKPDEKKVRWEDVAGLDEVRRILLEAIEIPLLHEELMREMDVKPAKGLLLFGPPGCGKTMIVKAAANELNANFLVISGTEIMKNQRKPPSVQIREIFNRARESAPALIFIDEIEALAPSRTKYIGGVLTELLQEIDGVNELKNVMVVGATNKPFMLDEALLRPGRFDKILYIPPPDEEARKKVFAIGLAKFLEGVDLDVLAKATEGYSGADIASICQEAKMEAVRRKLRKEDFKITTEEVLNIIYSRKPSISKRSLEEYAEFAREYGERI